MEENLNHVGLFIGPEDDDLPVEGEYDIAFFSGKLKNFFAYSSVLCSWTTSRAPVRFNTNCSYFYFSNMLIGKPGLDNSLAIFLFHV